MTKTSLTNNLSLFGLSANEQTIFLLLVKKQWQTVLQLARQCEIKRSSIYRILDSLVQKGLVEVQVDHKTTYYQAASPQSFESLTIHSAQKVKQMQTVLPDLSMQLQLLTKIQNSNQTAVHFYRGLHGIRTLEWRTCAQPNSESLVFGTNQWSDVMGWEFAERIRQERVDKNIKIRELLNVSNDNYKYARGSWTANQVFFKKYYQLRLIKSEIININTEILVLPLGIIFYSFQNHEMVGIELENQQLSQMFKQLFELIWSQAITP